MRRGQGLPDAPTLVAMKTVAEAPPLVAVDSTPAPISVAADLRKLSGLDTGTLATIFGVSRTTYQNWIGGVLPHRARRERLYALQTLFQEAARRLGDSSAVERWLLTPIEPGGKRPLDYLGAGDDAVVCGLLLREGSSAVRLVPPDKRSAPRRRLSREELERALDDVRPAPAIEWYDLESESEPDLDQ